MGRVAAAGEPWVVPKNAKPVAELRPYTGARAASPFGLHPGLKIHGDMLASLPEDEWKLLT